MKNNINYINNEFLNCNDLIHKTIKINLKTYHIFYLETVASGDRVNNYILKSISNKTNILNINKNLPSPNFIKLDDTKKINYYLYNGFTIILNNKNIYAVETRAELDRSISEPTSEPSLYGPKDAFNENIQKNLGLIKRRIKSNNLKNEIKILGRNTKTIINILYLDNIVDKNLLKDILNKLDNFDIDSLLDAGVLKKILENNLNPFPTIKLTEKPDLACINLLDGKRVILVDGSPYALIMPAFLIDFLNPINDDYFKPTNAIFLKMLRLICFLLTIIVPAFYIAITTYNQETIPLPLLINFSAQRSGVPFPAIVEAIIMILTCEILKESDLRFPNHYGSAISILGALILGEAAVSAGIVSPIMIIIVAVTFISALLFTDNDISGAIRFWRFIFLIFSVFFGLYGISLALLAFLINITSYKSMYLNYTFPIEPNDKNYAKHIILGLNTNKRSKYLTKNIIKSNIPK